MLDTIRSLLQRARSRFVVERPAAGATSPTRRAALRCRSRRLVLVCRRSWRAWPITALATFAVIGILYFFAAVTTAELLRPLYDPVQRTISELAVGPFGFLQTSAFVALGLSLLALQHALARHLRHTVVSRSALVLLASCGVASFVAAAFPTNLKGAVATVAGTIHESVAGVGYAGLIIAIILLSAHFRRDERWRAFFTASASLAVIGAGGSIFMAATSDTDLSGLSQRVMVIPLLLWVVLTALRLRGLLHQAQQEPLPVAQEPVRRPTGTARR